ncbi:TIGR03621 family F420-dependent LLM class oxidoreductase [Mycobacterium sp. M26]|uniref:TIGR03621 family F420-dependent LLM class oxidoreductase n=1 Tax=Mycobacterium sp. M26 TaxID=1762962 RepID=UPI00073E89F1|nr:TIGR03621 family F420-dependent LLM class oxidoreductase [Mycobacterium sp. M26]
MTAIPQAQRPFKFGIEVIPFGTRTEWRAAARRVQDLGYDVLQVPDHLGAPAPFAALLTAADVTEITLGTFVMNVGFYKPALLARDVEAVARLTDGRLELGLGTGYAEHEFEAAELPFPSAGRRVDYLEHTTHYLEGSLPDVPIMIAGSGDRVLTLAARHSAIIGFTGGKPGSTAEDPLLDRVEFVRAAAGDRADDLEFNLCITACPTDDHGKPDLGLTRVNLPDLSEDELLALPTVLKGTVGDMADQLREQRERYGISYISVQQHHADQFAKVIAELR